MKFLAALVTLIYLTGEATAQGSYMNAGFGYGLPAGDRLGTTEPNNNAEENVYGSFGKGLTIGLNTGYMVKDYIGFDLGIWYVIGSTYEFVTNGDRVHQVSGHTLRIMPNVKVTGGDANKPYAKFGLILGVSTVLNDNETFTSGGNSVYADHEFTGGSSFGWTGAFGIDFSEN